MPQPSTKAVQIALILWTISISNADSARVKKDQREIGLDLVGHNGTEVCGTIDEGPVTRNKDGITGLPRALDPSPGA